MQDLESSEARTMTSGQDQEFAEVKEHKFKVGPGSMTVGLSLATSQMQRIGFNQINTVK